MSLPTTVNTSQLIAGIDRSLNSIRSASADGKAFLKLQKNTSIWIYGTEEIEVEEGSIWAVNPGSFMTGFQAWAPTGGTMLGEEMREVVGDPIILANLPDVGAPWKPAISFELACTNGEDKGVQVRYSTNSRGGLRAGSGLLNELVNKLRQAPDSAEIVPLVMLSADSYKHKTYGKIYTPEFVLQGFANVDDTFAPSDGVDDDGEDVQEPVAAAVIEPDVEPEKPARRTRRRGRAATA